MDFVPGPSWCHPALAARLNPDGSRAAYAATPIPANTLLCVMGGQILSAATFATLSPDEQRRAIQVGEAPDPDGRPVGLYLHSNHPNAITDCLNHACDPNTVLEGAASLRARRDIPAGEEICYDYATSDGTPYDEFDCSCGSPLCRGRITGEDWRRPELQARYQGQFSPYLQVKIASTR